MKTIYLVRHAEPNFENRDDSNRELTRKGLKDRNKLIDIFNDIELDGIFSSPYKRAIDTIMPCSKNKGINIVVVNDFRERKVGKWVEDFDSFAKKQWVDFHYKLENGESLEEVQKRNIKALQEYIKDNETVIISGHGTAISTIINYYDKEFGYKDFKSLKMPSVIKLELDGMGALMGYSFQNISLD